MSVGLPEQAARGKRLRMPNDYGCCGSDRGWRYHFPGILAGVHVRHYYGYGCYGLDEKIITKARPPSAGTVYSGCERGSGRVLGVQVLGEGATDLVHLGQAAIATGATADFFIEQIFNFPTMTEAYRIAAFDILKQRSQVQPAARRVAGAMG